MKGIILAGGTGSRLWPITKATSKQLLPVYNKPLIYYPLSTLMLAGIREILVITTPESRSSFELLLGNGNPFGMSIEYATQANPEGIAQAFIVGEDFIGDDSVALILGDNIFYGPGLGRRLSQVKAKNGATIFGVIVQDPERYGVVEISETGQVISLEEKPLKPKSNIAVPGLYFFDNSVVARSKQISKSLRGEYEITSVIQTYIDGEDLEFIQLSSNTNWMDCGTFESLYQASSLIEKIESKSKNKIGSIEEVAYRNKWIDASQLRNYALKLSRNEYSEYLLSLAQDEILHER
jgi:glucose-1-phosphate thymidylyltransferase